MSVAQVIEGIRQLSPKEREEVENILRILKVVEAPGYRERIAQAHAEMDAGKKVSQAEVEAYLAKRDQKK